MYVFKFKDLNIHIINTKCCPDTDDGGTSVVG